jgi:hypothetical protein
MAEEAGLDWRALSGSAPGGRIDREDVAQALESETRFFALRENLVSSLLSLIDRSPHIHYTACHLRTKGALPCSQSPLLACEPPS